MEKHKERERKIRVCSMSVQKQATSIDREGPWPARRSRQGQEVCKGLYENPKLRVTMLPQITLGD